MPPRLPEVIVICTLSSCNRIPKDTSKQPVSVGVGLGTMGSKVKPTYQATPTLGVRVPIGVGSIKRDLTIEV